MHTFSLHDGAALLHQLLAEIEPPSLTGVLNVTTSKPTAR